MKKYLIFVAAFVVVSAGIVLAYLQQFQNENPAYTGSPMSQQNPDNSPQKTNSLVAVKIESDRNLKRLTEGCLAERDCANAIDNPKYLTVKKADFMNDEDMVIQIGDEKESYAFPVKIMAWHQVVNTIFGKKQIIVSFSPLTSSMNVFAASIDKGMIKSKDFVFSVSSKLLNNNAVLYDSALKGSYLNQFDGVFLTGSLTGEELTRLPFKYVSFGDLRKKYPNTLLLDRPDKNINYDQFPFEGYTENPVINFPVEHEDSRDGGKEIVYAVKVNNIIKAYPLKQMQQSIVPGVTNGFSDIIGETRIEFSYKDGFWSVKNLQDNNEIIPYVSYWFAVAAFNPNLVLAAAEDFQSVI